MVFKRKKKTELIIEHIKSRFLQGGYAEDDYESIKDILDLPTLAIKGMGKIEAAEIKEIYNIDTIRGLGQLDPINPVTQLLPEDAEDLPEPEYNTKVKTIIDKVLEAIPDFEEFRNHITIASMIKRSWYKRSDYTKKTETKVLCVGLDNAGKTAILSGLGGRLGISDLANLKPTKKVDRRKVSAGDMDLFVWDMGGQEQYRRAYLKEPEQYFIGTDMMLYVIDMQDPERYEESFDYISQIMDIIKLMGETPYILSFMHKSDPDILDDPDYQVNSEYVAEKLNEMFEGYDFEYDIYTTSIYNFFTSEPKFSKFIKDNLTDKESLSSPMVQKVKGLGDILDSTLNAIVTLANSLGEQIADLTARIEKLEQRVARKSGIPDLPETTAQKTAKKTPPPKDLVKPPASQQVIYTKKSLTGRAGGKSSTSRSNSGRKDPRMNVLTELRGLFQAKKKLDEKTRLGSLGGSMTQNNDED